MIIRVKIFIRMIIRVKIFIHIKNKHRTLCKLLVERSLDRSFISYTSSFEQSELWRKRVHHGQSRNSGIRVSLVS